MIFKVLFRVMPSKHIERYPDSTICKIIAVENGTHLESRIDNIIMNLKADGYDTVDVVDCLNISEPSCQCR